MQKFLIFFLTIAILALLYFGYISVVGKMMKDNRPHEPSETERLLSEQSDRIHDLNQDYRRVMEDNRRTMEDNRREMENLRRQLQH